MQFFFHCQNIHFSVFLHVVTTEKGWREPEGSQVFLFRQNVFCHFGDKSFGMQTWHVKRTRHGKHTRGKRTTWRAHRQEAANHRRLCGSDKREQRKNMFVFQPPKKGANVHMVYIFRDTGEFAHLCSLTFSYCFPCGQASTTPTPTYTHLQAHTTHTATDTIWCVCEKTQC